VSTSPGGGPTSRQRRIAVGILLVIALIPLGAAISELVGARDLMGAASNQIGQVGTPTIVVPPFSKSGTRQHFETPIRLSRGSTVTIDDGELFDAVKPGDQVDVEIRGGGSHVASVRLADGRRIVIGDSLAGALIFALGWLVLAAAIVTVALLLARRARRLATP
jgi:hypothetical protein